MTYTLPVYSIALVRERSLKATSDAIHAPSDAVRIFRNLCGDMDREALVELMLDAKNTIRGVNVVSIGDLCSTLAHPREVFKPAILASAVSIVLIHGHPSSGNPMPSSEDIAVAKRLRTVGELLGIHVADSIVAGDNGYVSLNESGYF